MIDYYLKTENAAALWQALESAGIAVLNYDPDDAANQRPEDATEDWTPQGATFYSHAAYDLDIIGTIYKDSGEVDSEGNPVLAPIDGFHANLRRQDSSDLSAEQKLALPLIQPPNNPHRRWA